MRSAPSGVVEIYSQQVTSPHRGAWARIKEAPPMYGSNSRKIDNNMEQEELRRRRPISATLTKGPVSDSTFTNPSNNASRARAYLDDSEAQIGTSSPMPTLSYLNNILSDSNVQDDCEENNLLRLRIAELEERLASEKRIAEMHARHRAKFGIIQEVPIDAIQEEQDDIFLSAQRAQVSKASQSPRRATHRSPSPGKFEEEKRKALTELPMDRPAHDNFLHTTPLTSLSPLTGHQHAAFEKVMVRLQDLMSKRSRFKEDFVHTFSDPDYLMNSVQKKPPQVPIRGDPLAAVRRRIQLHERAATTAEELGIFSKQRPSVGRKKRRPRSAAAVSERRRPGSPPTLKKKRHKKKKKRKQEKCNLGETLRPSDEEEELAEFTRGGAVRSTAAFETFRQSRSQKMLDDESLSPKEYFDWELPEFSDALHERSPLPGQTLSAKAVETLRNTEVSPRATIGWDASAEMARRGDRGSFLSGRELRASRRQFQAVAGAAVLRLQQWIRGILCRERLLRESAAVVVIIFNSRSFLARLRYWRRRRAWVSLSLKLHYQLWQKGRRCRCAAVRIQCLQRQRIAINCFVELRLAAAAVRVQCLQRKRNAIKRIKELRLSFSIILQRYSRGFLARTRVAALLAARARAIAENAAAVVLQSRVRGSADRSWVHKRQCMSCIMQRGWRCFVSRCDLKRRMAVCTIQRSSRCAAARRCLAREKDIEMVRRWHLRRRTAAERIQSFKRGQIGRRKAKLRRVEIQENLAAERLQNNVKIFLARRKRQQLHEKRRIAAIVIQCIVRTAQARMHTSKRRSIVKRHLRLVAVICIQKNVRMSLSISKVRRHRAILVLQKSTRQFLEVTRLRRREAALLLQRTLQIWVAMRHVRLLRILYETPYTVAQAAGAVEIQKIQRGRLGRAAVSKFRMDKAVLIIQQLQRRRQALRRSRYFRRQHLCATELQRIWRGRCGRQRAYNYSSVKRLGELEVQTAIVLQNFWRTNMAKEEASKRKNFLMVTKAATVLQAYARMWRYHYSRKRQHLAEWKEQLQHHNKEKRHKAAIVLQSMARRRGASIFVQKAHLQTRAKTLQPNAVVSKQEHEPLSETLQPLSEKTENIVNASIAESSKLVPRSIGGLGPGFGMLGADFFDDDSIEDDIEIIESKPKKDNFHRRGNEGHESDQDYDEFDVSFTRESKSSKGADNSTSAERSSKDVHSAENKSDSQSIPPASNPGSSLGKPDSLDASQSDGVFGGNDRWETYLDPETLEKYYHDTETGETTWIEPDVLIQARGGGVTDNISVESHHSVSLGQQGNWVKYLDDSSSMPYWYNLNTNKSTWTKPPGWKDDTSMQKNIVGQNINSDLYVQPISQPVDTTAANVAATSQKHLGDRKSSSNSMVSVGSFGSAGIGGEQQGNWVRYIDEASNTPYFYNIVSKKSSWTQPPGWKLSKFASSQHSSSFQNLHTSATNDSQEGRSGHVHEVKQHMPFRLQQPNSNLAFTPQKQQQFRFQQQQQQPLMQSMQHQQHVQTPIRRPHAANIQSQPWQPQSIEQTSNFVQGSQPMPWQQQQQPFRLQQQPLGSMPRQQQSQQPIQLQFQAPMHQQRSSPGNFLGLADTRGISPNRTVFGQDNSDSDDSYRISSYNVGL